MRRMQRQYGSHDAGAFARMQRLRGEGDAAVGRLAAPPTKEIRHGDDRSDKLSNPAERTQNGIASPCLQ
jgi:hypothetical protein